MLYGRMSEEPGIVDEISSLFEPREGERTRLVKFNCTVYLYTVHTHTRHTVFIQSATATGHRNVLCSDQFN